MTDANRKTRVYNGWVPTTSGRLSFSVIGDTDQPARAVTENLTRRDTTYLISYQRRETSDITGPWPRPWNKYLGPLFFGLDGDMWFVCVASADTNTDPTKERLKGSIFIIDRTCTWRANLEPKVKYAQQNLRDCGDVGFVVGKNVSAANILSNAAEELAEDCAFACTFELRRNGDICIEVDSAWLGLYKSLFRNDSMENAQYFETQLAAQSYYFIKDITHNHQHHRPSSDQILHLVEVTDSDDDVDWRRHILYDLYRKIIDDKRLSDTTRFYDVRGILAYANSFRAIFRNTLREKGFSKKEIKAIVPWYSSENVRKSIESGRERNQFLNEIENTKTQHLRNSILVAFTIIFSLIGVVGLGTSPDKLSDPAEGLLFVAEFILLNPTLSLISIVIPIYLWRGWRNIKQPAKWTLQEDVWRLFQAYPKRVVGIALIVFGILLAGGAFIVPIMAGWIEVTLPA